MDQSFAEFCAIALQLSERYFLELLGEFFQIQCWAHMNARFYLSVAGKYLFAFIAIVLLFVAVGPAAGSNFLLVVPGVLLFAYVIGAIPAAIAGAIFAFFMLLTYNRDEPENTLGWNFGLLVGGFVGLFAVDLVGVRSVPGADVISTIYMVCGGIGGGLCGGLAKYVVRPILGHKSRDKLA
ncbi:hypothetical protein [Chitinimonas sp.]|uniref:hypothetical protein n=1 Tax=Chitinimonas sp. TaxID=1934313 RepID=UPI0035B4C224